MYSDGPINQAPVLFFVGVFVVAILTGWLRSRRWWPVLVRRLDGAAHRLGNACWARWCGLVCPLYNRVMAWLESRSSGAAYERRKLGEYLASLPPHSGLTTYEEMANDIAALPPGPGKVAVQAYFRKYAKPPSADCVASARAKRGQSRVNVGVVNALLRGELPYYMQAQNERGWL